VRASRGGANPLSAHQSDILVGGRRSYFIRRAACGAKNQTNSARAFIISRPGPANLLPGIEFH